MFTFAFQGLGLFLLGAVSCFIFLAWYGKRKQKKILKYVSENISENKEVQTKLQRMKQEIDKKFLEDELKLKIETEKKINKNRYNTIKRLFDEDK